MTYQELHPFAIPFRLDLRQEVVRGYPVAPPAEHSYAIHLKEESCPFLPVELVLYN